MGPTGATTSTWNSCIWLQTASGVPVSWPSLLACCMGAQETVTPMSSAKGERAVAGSIIQATVELV